MDRSFKQGYGSLAFFFPTLWSGRRLQSDSSESWMLAFVFLLFPHFLFVIYQLYHMISPLFLLAFGDRFPTSWARSRCGNHIMIYCDYPLWCQRISPRPMAMKKPDAAHEPECSHVKQFCETNYLK